MELFDTHIHSSYSFDGHDSIDKICQAAINKGLKSITITDHYDVDYISLGKYQDVDFKNVKKDINEARTKYNGQLEIGFGVEIGQGAYLPNITNKILIENNFDIVLCSIHNLKDSPDFCNIDYDNLSMETINDYLNEYFDMLYESTSIKGITTITHISYPLRYLFRHGIILNLLDYKDKYIELFKLIIKNGLALEYNVAGLRKGYLPSPTLDIMKLYYEIGGRKITVGSDAHYASDVGSDILNAYKDLKQIGFNKVLAYKDNKITELEI